MSDCTLTARQAEVLEFISDYIGTHGYPPSERELADACKLGSPSGAHRMILVLEGKGFLERIPGRSRGRTIAQANVDYSKMDLSDLIRLRTMAAQHSVIRDAQLMVAARHPDETVTEQVVSDALERTRRVIALTEVVSDLLPDIDVVEHVRPLRQALLPREDTSFTDFALDDLVVNRMSAVLTENLTNTSPVQRAVLWPDLCLFRASAARAEQWLHDELGVASAGDVVSAWSSRGAVLAAAMLEMTSSIDRVFRKGNLSVEFDADVFASLFAPEDGTNDGGSEPCPASGCLLGAGHPDSGISQSTIGANC